MHFEILKIGGHVDIVAHICQSTGGNFDILEFSYYCIVMLVMA